jgi:hypothetical protein
MRFREDNPADLERARTQGSGVFRECLHLS